MTQMTLEKEEQLPPWAWAIGILSIVWLIGLFFTVRAYSADFWAEDGAYGPYAASARR